MPLPEFGRIKSGVYTATSEILPSSVERSFGQAVCSNMLTYRNNSSSNNTSGFSCPFIKKHLSRIQHAAKEWFGSKAEFSDPIYEKVLLEQIGRLFVRNPELNAIRVRLLSSGQDLEIIFSEYLDPWASKTATGITLIPIVGERKTPELKLSGDQVCLEARTLAVSKGFDEALLTSNTNIVLEGAWSNFFWIDHNQHLRSADSGVLPGIVRTLILEEFDCHLGAYTLGEILNKAQGAFVTQATSGITRVSKIGDVSLPKDDLAILDTVNQWYRKTSIGN